MLYGNRIIVDNSSEVSNTVLAVENSRVVQVSPALSTAIYADGDVLFDAVAIPLAVRTYNGTGEIRSVCIIDKSNQGAAFDLWFLNANVSFGVVNNAPTLTAADATAALGRIIVATGDYDNFATSRIACPAFQPIMIQSGLNSGELYVAGVSRGTGTYATDGLVLNIGIARF